MFISTLAVGAIIFAIGMWAAITSQKETPSTPDLPGTELAILAAALNLRAAEIMKESVATGESIIDIPRSKNLLSEKEIAEILDPVSMTEPQYPKEAAKKRDEVKAK